MRTTRIEFDGDAGHVTIERRRGCSTIRIDSIIRDASRHEQSWKTWELDAGISDEELFKVAAEVQQRTDGKRGTHSMINDYFREMQRFQN